MFSWSEAGSTLKTTLISATIASIFTIEGGLEKTGSIKSRLNQAKTLLIPEEVIQAKANQLKASRLSELQTDSISLGRNKWTK